LRKRETDRQALKIRLSLPPPLLHIHTNTTQLQRKDKPQQIRLDDLSSDLEAPPPASSHANATPGITLASCTLFLIVTALVVLGTILTVITKVMTIPMANYTAALTLQTVFAYVPLTLIYIWIRHKMGKLLRADLFYPWKPVVAVSFLYALGQALLIFGTQYTSGPMQVILSQSAIPFSMGISHVMLGSTYRRRHYIGALLVFLGIVLAVGGWLAREQINAFEAGWIVGYILSWVPYVIYTVYSESLFKQRATPPDPVIFTGIISAVQFLFLCFLAPIFPYLQKPPAPLSSLPASLLAGLKCLVGINTLPSDDCWPLAPSLVLTYNILNIVLLYPTFALLEHGSSNLFWLACTLIVPLSGFAFSLPFIPEAQPVTLQNGLALLVIVVGLGTYGFSKKSAGRGLDYIRQASPRHVLQRTMASSSENLAALLEMIPWARRSSSSSSSSSLASSPSARQRWTSGRKKGGKKSHRLPPIPPSPAPGQKEEEGEEGGREGGRVGWMLVDGEEGGKREGKTEKPEEVKEEEKGGRKEGGEEDEI